MSRPIIIGLTGQRSVGKSTAAQIMERQFGFVSVHPYAGGKVAAMAYFRHLGADEDLAWRMVYGDMKDCRSDILPGRATPRHFMEEDGRFRGTVLGYEWTLGAELDRATRKGVRRIVVESIVYEAPALAARGGLIYRIERPGHQGPAGTLTGPAQAGIPVDGTIENNGILESYERAVAEFIRRVVIDWGNPIGA